MAEALASVEVAGAVTEVVEAEKTDEAAKGALAEVADAVPHAF